MNAEEFKNSIAPLLKKQKFKKSSTTWRRHSGDSVAVLNVQKSSWGGGDYYINLGVYFRELGDNLNPAENKCHVQVRLDLDVPSIVVETAINWFDARKTLQLAALLAESDSKKGLVFKEVRNATLR